MLIAILNDTHAGVRNSSDIYMDYQERFYRDVFFPYLKENNIKNILHLGDYWDHRKYINFKALNHNRKVFLDVLKKDGITMDIIPGNHDVFHKSTNDLCSLKELMGFYTSNVNIIMEPRVLDFDGCRIGMIPWINNENYADTMKFLANCKAPFIGGHFEFSGFEMNKGHICTSGMSTEAFGRFEAVWSGHYHTKSTLGNISYLGAQMEFNWADVDDPKYFHVFDTETRKLTKIKNPLTLHTKIIYDDSTYNYDNYDVNALAGQFVKLVVGKKGNSFDFDRFVDRIQDADIHELKIAESFSEYLGENIDDEGIEIEETATLLDSYVDGVTSDLETNRMKIMMRSLYTEAVNLEIA
jgi:DNA repair exonuclease SbcCD nuclease subunit